jgi:hypothetical protein
MADHRPTDRATKETEDDTQVPRDLPDQPVPDEPSG